MNMSVSMPTIGPDHLSEAPLSAIEQTLLSPTANLQDIEALCEDAVEYGFAAVCVPPNLVAAAAAALYGSSVRVVSVVGFPCGYSLPQSKAHETVELLDAGAQEIDLVMPVGRFLAGETAAVRDELQDVVLAAEDQPVKVIIECCYLDQEQKRRAAELVAQSGAAYVKTSTGFGPGGAQLEDVRLLKTVLSDRLKIKAAGGIRTLDDCRAFLEAGASRIGTSAGRTIARQWSTGRPE